jgi:hypothetical protein
MTTQDLLHSGLSVFCSELIWLNSDGLISLLLSSGTSLSLSLLPAISRHDHSWHQAQLGSMATDLLFLPIVKGGVGSFLTYRLVFTYHTLFHLILHSFSPPPGITDGFVLISYITSGWTDRQNIFSSRIQGNVCLLLSDGLFPRTPLRGNVFIDQ